MIGLIIQNRDNLLNINTGYRSPIVDRIDTPIIYATPDDTTAFFDDDELYENKPS